MTSRETRGPRYFAGAFLLVIVVFAAYHLGGLGNRLVTAALILVIPSLLAITLADDFIPDGLTPDSQAEYFARIVAPVGLAAWITAIWYVGLWPVAAFVALIGIPGMVVALLRSPSLQEATPDR